MRTIIAGSRDGIAYGDVLFAMEEAARVSDIRPSLVISGTARGTDRLGEFWAGRNGVPVRRMPADWKTHGPALAGRLRNEQMAEVAEALVAVWNGRSSGTAHMIDTAVKRGLRIYVHRVDVGRLQYVSGRKGEAR